jgi:hypothetical protein
LGKAGKNTFFNNIKISGILAKGNTSQAIWQVGKGDGVFLEIINEGGAVKDWEFLNRWVMGKKLHDGERSVKKLNFS